MCMFGECTESNYISYAEYVQPKAKYAISLKSETFERWVSVYTLV